MPEAYAGAAGRHAPRCLRHPKARYRHSLARGMDVSEAARLKSLEDKNAKLKRLLADTMLDNVVLKDLLGKN